MVYLQVYLDINRVAWFRRIRYFYPDFVFTENFLDFFG